MSAPSPHWEDPAEVAALAEAYQRFADTADTVTADPTATLTAPAGEWNAEQILAHVSLVTAVTIAAVAAITSGGHATYDNRIALQDWTIDRTAARAGGIAGLRRRIQGQAHALCTLAALACPAELATPVPTLLLSGETVLVDQMVSLGDLLTGLTDTEIPGHAAQLHALLPAAVSPGDPSRPPAS